ncbi:MAG TPA: SDR family oxidoreductase [Gaiellaceae bacterium]|jgi:NAD(P)-dependent dehydrogenase (short-subunit alcohol dehydrogenase family)
MPERIFVTGASRGLGRALVVELQRRGHEMLAAARDLDALSDLEAAEKLALDVDDPGSVEAAVKAAGEVDVLVNNAAVTVQSPVEAIPVEIFGSILETNVLGPLRLIHALVPGMRERGRGTIVNVSSRAVRSAPPLQGPYAASKAALELLSDVLRKELQPFGIRVIVIDTGGVRTEMRARQRKYGGEPYAELIEQFESRMAEYDRQGGGSEPDEIASAIADVLEDTDPPAVAQVG